MWDAVWAGAASGLAVSLLKDLVAYGLKQRGKRGDEAAQGLRSAIEEAMRLKELYDERRVQIEPTRMRVVEPTPANGEPRSEPVFPRDTFRRKRRANALIAAIGEQETKLQTAISAAAPKNYDHVVEARDAFFESGRTFITHWSESSDELMEEAYDEFLAVLRREISKS